ncbi:hypothetical protein O3M35_007193 [Rhynocoris fuscipes]|uniref:Uncharacterized protein n=1 Tax=Rhynocoris fuscipes TaxID=488301 RepID=A0AAW1DB52_9HEMI
MDSKMLPFDLTSLMTAVAQYPDAIIKILKEIIGKLCQSVDEARKNLEAEASKANKQQKTIIDNYTAALKREAEKMNKVSNDNAANMCKVFQAALKDIAAETAKCSKQINESQGASIKPVMDQMKLLQGKLDEYSKELTNKLKELRGTEKPARVVRGFPQVRSLLPHLWCPKVDELLWEMNRRGDYLQMYSDDGVILITGKRLSTVSGVMQTALCHMEKWCKKLINRKIKNTSKMCDDGSSTCPIRQKSEEILKILRLQMKRLVDTIDDACKRLDIVSKTASDEQKSTIETIKTTLINEAEKLRKGSKENAEDMNKALKEAVEVVSTELEKVSKDNLLVTDTSLQSLTKKLDDFKKRNN